MKILIDASYPSRVRIYEKHCPTIRNYGSGGNKMPLVLDIQKSTNTQSKSITKIFHNTKTMETSQKSTPKNSKTSTCSAEDSHAKLFLSLESELDSKTPEELSSMMSFGLSKKNSPSLCYSKTSKDCFLTTTETLLKPSSPRLQNWGMLSNGKCLTQKITECHKTETECSLSDILEDSVDEKYFLSEEQTERLLGKIRSVGGGRNSLTKKHAWDIVIVPEATKQGYAVAEEGDSINLAVLGSKTRRGRVGKKIAQTLDTGMQQHILKNKRVRRLIPMECERLMGLKDRWTEGVSDSQRYKLCGNGVVVNVVEQIIKKLI